MCCAGSLTQHQLLGDQPRTTNLETGSQIGILELSNAFACWTYLYREEFLLLSDPSKVTWQQKERLLRGLQFQISDKNLQSYPYHTLLRNP